MPARLFAATLEPHPVDDLFAAGVTLPNGHHWQATASAFLGNVGEQDTLGSLPLAQPRRHWPAGSSSSTALYHCEVDCKPGLGQRRSHATGFPAYKAPSRKHGSHGSREGVTAFTANGPTPPDIKAADVFKGWNKCPTKDEVKAMMKPCSGLDAHPMPGMKPKPLRDEGTCKKSPGCFWLAEEGGAGKCVDQPPDKGPPPATPSPEDAAALEAKCPDLKGGGAGGDAGAAAGGGKEADDGVGAPGEAPAGPPANGPKPPDMKAADVFQGWNRCPTKSELKEMKKPCSGMFAHHVPGMSKGKLRTEGECKDRPGCIWADGKCTDQPDDKGPPPATPSPEQKAELDKKCKGIGPPKPAPAAPAPPPEEPKKEEPVKKEEPKVADVEEASFWIASADEKKAAEE